MTSRHVLEVTHKEVVDQRASHRPNDRGCQYRGLFGDLNLKANRNSRDEPDQRRRGSFRTSLGQILGGFGDGLPERSTR